MRYNCWIKSTIVKQKLRAAFANIDNVISGLIKDRPGIDERTIDGYLGSSLAKLSLNFQDTIEERPCEILIGIEHLPHSIEIDTGADIGMVAQIKTPGKRDKTKGVLIQSKRLYPDENEKFTCSSEYKRLFDSKTTNAGPQWDRMRKVTCSSKYMFYGPKQIQINKKSKRLGIRMVNTQKIQNLYRDGTSSFSAQDSIEHGKSFSSWLVNDFICCIEGDSDPEVIAIAMGNNKKISVSRTVKINIAMKDISKNEIR